MNEKIIELLNQVKSTADFGYVAFDSINSTNAFGDNALHCVCVWGDFESAKLLVENGININQVGEHGFTPLRVANEFGYIELVEYLISIGADKNSLHSEETFDAEANARHMQRINQQMAALEKQIEACERSSKKAKD